MTDHEGIQASKHPKLADVKRSGMSIAKCNQDIQDMYHRISDAAANIDRATLEVEDLNQLIDDTDRGLRIFFILMVVAAIAVVLVIVYANEIDAWRIAL